MMSPRTLVLCLAVLNAAACGTSEFKGSSEKLNPTVTREFQQKSYPKANAELIQGFAGTPATESFNQGEWGALDLLVVVDNSGSMLEEQTNLATKLEPLMKYIDKSDWQIAVVTTDPTDGCQRALIKKGEADAAQKFQNAVNAGITGTGVERIFKQAVEGLKGTCNSDAQPWVRPGSTLSVLMLTDEDNCHIDETQGYGCDGEPDRTAGFMIDYLKSIRQLGKDARAYGLMWHPSQPKDSCKSALKDGTELAKVIQATVDPASVDPASQGWGSICDADYTKTLEGISKDISQILKYEFELGEAPDAASLGIKVDGQAWTKYEIAGKKVTFTEAPPFGAKVEVDYKHGAEGEVTGAFALPKAPVDGSFKITIDGEEVADDAYSWDPKAKKLIFKNAPAERAKIEVAYESQIALETVFDLNTLNIDAKTLVVTVDGVRVADSAYKLDAKTGKVTFTTPPAAGGKVRMSYKDKQ